MKLNSISFKIGTTIMILFLIVLLPLGFFIDRIFLQIYTTQVHKKANELSKNLTSGDYEFDAEFYHDIAVLTGKEIVVFNKDGIVLTHTVFDYTTESNIPNELLDTLRQKGHLEREFIDASTNEQYFFVGRPIMENNAFNGGILIFSSIDEIHNIMHTVRNWIVIAIVGSIIIALGYTLFITNKLAKPLIKMEKATREIAKGNLNTRIKRVSNDEVGSLGQAINELSIELNNYRANRSELLANISHELLTPISYLKGYSQLIVNHQYKDNTDLEMYATIINKESDRLSKLIQDLFELSKMEEGNLHLVIQEIDVEELIKSVIQKLHLKANKKNLKLTFKIDEKLKHIISDGARIEQILINLLENAINYSVEGSIHLEAIEEKDFVLLSVKDTGLGIPEEDLPFIFDRFHRVEKSRSREMGGTGLGLAIISELVKQLNGSIEVKSKYGIGTQFIIKLPKI